jgi:asparagine synthase (glutamine-hydrolysing)
MPNLVGIRNPALSADEIRGLLSKQLKRTRIPGIEFQEHLCVHPGFGMALMDHGILENGKQPAQTPDGRFYLMLDGELYNADELRIRYARYLPGQALSVPELCLQLLTLQGEKVLSQFNGLFCILLYEASTRRLTIISDRYGFRPFYWVQRESAFLFGSELKSICAADPVPRRIDEIGTFELFAYGSHFMERTWLDGYSRIPPATILTVDDSGVQTRAYWDYKYAEGTPALNQDTYSAVFGTLLDRAVERTMQGSKRIGIFLSGG